MKTSRSPLTAQPLSSCSRKYTETSSVDFVLRQTCLGKHHMADHKVFSVGLYFHQAEEHDGRYMFGFQKRKGGGVLDAADDAVLLTDAS